MYKFRWRKPAGGFKWVTPGADWEADEAPEKVGKAKESDLLLVPRTPYKLQDVELFDESPGLFEAFAGLACNRGAVVEFADEYGNLGAEVDLLEWASDDGTGRRRDSGKKKPAHADLADDGGKYRIVDTYGRWAEEIKLMRELLDVWDDLKDRFLDADESVKFRRRLNAKLAGLRVGVEVRVPEPDLAKSGIVLVPRNLLQAMWVQFAAVVAGDRSLLRCEWCKQLRRVNEKTKHGNTTYCSEECRKAKIQTEKRKRDEFHSPDAQLKPLKKLARSTPPKT